jgi:hypothetical protein
LQCHLNRKWKIKPVPFRVSNRPGGNRREICGNLQLYVEDLAIKRKKMAFADKTTQMKCGT